VGFKLFKTRPADHVKADHFKCPPGRSASRIQQDQHAGDDGAVDLDLNPFLFGAQQVAATKQVLEHLEKQFEAE
jgi:hypothetical protein